MVLYPLLVVENSGGTTFDQLTVTGSGNTTTILPTSITLGSLKFSGNTLESSQLELNAPMVLKLMLIIN